MLSSILKRLHIRLAKHFGLLCPYNRIPFKQIPGYIEGYGCPVCKSITFYHLKLEWINIVKCVGMRRCFASWKTSISIFFLWFVRIASSIALRVWECQRNDPCPMQHMPNARGKERTVWFPSVHLSDLSHQIGNSKDERQGLGKEVTMACIGHCGICLRFWKLVSYRLMICFPCVDYWHFQKKWIILCLTWRYAAFVAGPSLGNC